jgi:type I restriction enzyme S subunit
LPFEAVFSDESGGNIKTPQSEYLPEGPFPVVDQGKALIGGYVNDSQRLCGEGRPAIVFGDHTRCIKHVNFPFCMGADGVKVLRPKIDADLKYLYYYLKTLKLPDAGYDRHFKYLKRTEVVVPPLTEQRRIAAILDQADALRAKRREALAQLDSLKLSIFIEMFGDPVTNPKGWPIVLMESITERITKGESPNWQGFDYQDEGVLFVTSENVRLGELDLTKKKFVPAAFHEKLGRSQLQKNDLLVNLVGASIGRSCLFKGWGHSANVNQAVGVVRAVVSLVTPTFLIAFLTSYHGQQILLGNRVEGARANISLTDLREIAVPLPPISEQAKFADRISTIEKIAMKEGHYMLELEALFASLQHRAFRGEL